MRRPPEAKGFNKVQMADLLLSASTTRRHEQRRLLPRGSAQVSDGPAPPPRLPGGHILKILPSGSQEDGALRIDYSYEAFASQRGLKDQMVETLAYLEKRKTFWRQTAASAKSK